MTGSKLVKCLGSTLLLLMILSVARADFIYSTSASAGGRSASATFTQMQVASNYYLQVVLTNTSPAKSSVPTDVLTAMFWDMNQSVGLTKVSATTLPTLILQPQYSNNDPTSASLIAAGNVGSEFAYRYDAAGLGGIAAGQFQYGVSSSGLGVFGPEDRFDTVNNLEGPDSPDGIQYGITSSLGLDPNHNGGLDHSLIQGSVTLLFNFSGNYLPYSSDAGFATLFGTVRYQFGTALSEPSITGNTIAVPAPSGIVLAGIGCAFLAGVQFYSKRRTPKLV